MEDQFKTHGAFSWNELMTRDAEGAKKFYAGLFGWKFKPFEEMVYNVVEVGGKEVAGIMEMTPDMPKDQPPAWNAYVTVDNVDESAKKAESLGGKVLFGPMDIPKVGRFAFIQDPQGAALGIITYKMEM